MATTRVSTNLSTIMSVLQLIFTIVAIAILSYKDYYQDCELSLIRGEVSSIRGEMSSGGPSNEISVPVQTSTPLSTADDGEEHESVRIRRVSQKKPSKAPSADGLQAECVQNMLKNLRVCMALLWCYLSILPK